MLINIICNKNVTDDKKQLLATEETAKNGEKRQRSPLQLPRQWSRLKSSEKKKVRHFDYPVSKKGVRFCTWSAVPNLFFAHVPSNMKTKFRVTA